jgi:hypothetical protein
MPNIDTNTYNFSFTSKISGNSYQFVFMWQAFSSATSSPYGEWRCYCIMPNATKRTFGVNPNAMNWSEYSDVAISFNTTLQWIGLNDWSIVSMYMYGWT